MSSSSPFGITFTPSKPGWDTGKLVLKLQGVEGPCLKVTIGLYGHGGVPNLTLVRDGQPLDNSLTLGILHPHAEIKLMEVSNSGDASGFIACRLFEDEGLLHPVDHVYITPDKAVVRPGETRTLMMRTDPDRCQAGFQSAFLVVYQGSEIARQVILNESAELD